MPSSEFSDYDCLLLKPFNWNHKKISFQNYAGGGRHGHVFKVLIDGKHYALEMVCLIEG